MRAVAIGALTLLGLALTGCAVSEAQVRVFAAASLAVAFEDLAADAGAAMSFSGSSGLVDQLAGGAGADVFASADTANMDRAVAAGLISGEPVKFATNRLVLVTPPDNPAEITGLDVSLMNTKLVICGPEVPCGHASQNLAADVGVKLEAVSEELSVTDVLGKVTSGEADAGLVYITDAIRAGDRVHQIQIPEAASHLTEYWIAPVAGGDQAAGAKFIERVTGLTGQKILAEHGFGAP